MSFISSLNKFWLNEKIRRFEDDAWHMTLEVVQTRQVRMEHWKPCDTVIYLTGMETAPAVSCKRCHAVRARSPIGQSKMRFTSSRDWILLWNKLKLCTWTITNTFLYIRHKNNIYLILFSLSSISFAWRYCME